MKGIKIVAIVVILITCIAGISVGLNNKSVEVDISSSLNSIKEIGVLEVLTVSSVVYDDISEVRANEQQYRVLYETPVTAIYSVNLSDLQYDSFIDDNGKKKLFVGIPALVASVSQNEEQRTMIAEFQKSSITGSIDNGYSLFNNSIKKSNEEITKQFQESEELMGLAKESAKKQIQLLIDAMKINNYETCLYFL